MTRRSSYDPVVDSCRRREDQGERMSHNHNTAMERLLAALSLCEKQSILDFVLRDLLYRSNRQTSYFYHTKLLILLQQHHNTNINRGSAGGIPSSSLHLVSYC